MANKWTEEKKKQLVEMKLSGVNWSEIAVHFGTTIAAVDRKFHYLQQDGLAPYKVHEYASKVDEILECYRVKGHRKTLEKYGLYALRYLRRNKLWERSTVPVPKYIEEFLSSKNRYYWAGFIAADGCIRNCNNLYIGLSIVDADHLLQIQNLMGGSVLLYPKRNTVEWNIHGASEVILFLKSLNIVPRKTKILKPPVLKNENQIRNFIRGYFDGDGCVTTSLLKSGSLVKTVTFLGTKKMLTWISASLKKYAKTNLSPKLVLSRGICVINYSSTHDFVQIKQWMYQESEVHLQRKHDRFQEIEELLKSRRSYKALQNVV